MIAGVPNVLLALLRALAWLVWRDPMDTRSKRPQRPPKPPRKPKLHFAVSKLRRRVHSVVRTTWFRQGVPVEVDQITIEEGPDADATFDYYIGQALRQGADVSVLSTKTPEELGIHNAHPI